MAAPSRKRQTNVVSQFEAHAEKVAWDIAELSIFYKNAPIGLYSVDRDFRFVRVNEYLAGMHGRPVADHIGRQVREIVPLLADRLEPLYRQVLESRKPILDVEIQWTSPTATGGPSDRICSYYPIEAENGSVIGISAVVRDITQQARAERALREREERYRLLFEKAADGLFVFHVNREGVPERFLEANEVACRMLGYSRDEFLKLSPHEFRDPDLPDPNFFLREALQKGQVVFEREIRTKAGARMPVEIRATAFELQGKPAILSDVRDISERKRAEAELQKSIDLNEQVLSSAQEGIVVADRELRLVAWNPFMESLSGVEKKSALGRNAFELFPFLRAIGVESLAERALSGEYITGLDFPFRIPATSKSGWVSVSTGPLRNGNGDIIGTLSTLRDISEQKRMDAALRESSEFNKQIIENMAEGIVVCDRELRPLLWNPFMQEISGFSEDQVLGKNVFDVFPFLRQQGVDAFFERALRGEACSAPEVPYAVPETQKSGWAAGHFGPLRDLKGEIIGVLVNVREISEHKEIEDELRRLSSRLLQLQDAERRRIARDLHDSFAQRVLAVNLNLALLSQAAAHLDERAKHALSEAREIMDSFAKEIRSISYLLHPPALDELGLASAIEEFAAGFSERSGIRVEVEIAPQIERLPQDAELALFRIVQECLANVQRHSGSPTAKIRLTRANQELVLEIADEGHWKGRKARKPLRESRTDAERLGVGILGMRERIRQLGGALEIASGATGTTVRAVLPLQEAVHLATSDSHR